MTEALILLAVAILAAAFIVVGVVRQSVTDYRDRPRTLTVFLRADLSKFTEAIRAAGVAAAQAYGSIGTVAALTPWVLPPSQAVIDLADEESQHAQLRSVLSSPREAARLWKALRIAITAGVDVEYLARLIASLGPDGRRP